MIDPKDKHLNLKIKLEIEDSFKDVSADIINKKKFYKAKPIVYPFNNLKGTYKVALLTYMILGEAPVN